MDDSPVEEYRNKMLDWGLPLSQYSQQCQACFAPQSGSGLGIIEMPSKVNKPINAGIHVRNIGTQFSGIRVL